MLLVGLLIGLWCLLSLPFGALVGRFFRRRTSGVVPDWRAGAQPTRASAKPAKPFVVGRQRDVRSVGALDMKQAWPTTISTS
jgi:hypothetical protein